MNDSTQLLLWGFIALLIAMGIAEASYPWASNLKISELAHPRTTVVKLLLVVIAAQIALGFAIYILGNRALWIALISV
jgi:hypothetical protein